MPNNSTNAPMLRVHCCNWYPLVTYPPCDVRIRHKDCGSPIPRSGLYAFSPCSDPRDDVGHKVSADPTNHPRGRHQRLETRSAPSDSGTPIDVDDICHPPIIRLHHAADNHGSSPASTLRNSGGGWSRPADGDDPLAHGARVGSPVLAKKLAVGQLFADAAADNRALSPCRGIGIRRDEVRIDPIGRESSSFCRFPGNGPDRETTGLFLLEIRESFSL